MQHVKKRLLGIVLSLAIAAGTVPFYAFAQTDPASQPESTPATLAESGGQPEVASEEQLEAGSVEQGNGDSGAVADPQAPVVAELNGQTYTSLQAAVDAADYGDTVSITAGAVITEKVTVNKSVTFSLQGNVYLQQEGTIELASNAYLKLSGGAIQMDANATAQALVHIGPDAAGATVVLAGTQLYVPGGKIGLYLQAGSLNADGSNGSYGYIRLMGENSHGILLDGATQKITADLSGYSMSIWGENQRGEAALDAIGNVEMRFNNLTSMFNETAVRLVDTGAGRVSFTADYLQDSQNGIGLDVQGANCQVYVRRFALTGQVLTSGNPSVTLVRGSSVADLSAYMQNSDMKIINGSFFYAPLFTITFDNMGKGTTPEPMQVSELSEPYVLPNLVQEGYIIRGWYLDTNFLMPWDVSTSLPMMSPEKRDITLYAKWDKLITTDTDVAPAPQPDTQPGPAATPAPTPAPTAVPAPAPAAPVTAPAAEEDNAAEQPVTATTQVEATVTDNTAVAAVDADTLDTTIDAAIANAENGAAPEVVVNVAVTGGAQAVEVTLPAAQLARLAENANAQLTLESKVARVTFDQTALTAIAGQAQDAVVLTVEPVAADALNAAQQEAVGEYPVFELTLQSGDALITSFNNGKAQIALPYTLADGQTADGIVVWYVDEAGAITPCVTNYDAAAQQVVFETTHFSKYVIAYEAPEQVTEPAPENQVQTPAETTPEVTAEPVSSFPVVPVAVVGLVLIVVVLLVVVKIFFKAKD